MRKLFLIATFAFVSLLGLNAQTFGIKGGLNLAKGYFKGNDMDYTSDNLVGFQIGGIFELGLNNNIYLNTGLLYSKKGWKTEEGTTEEKGILNYVVVPVTFSYKIDLGNAKLFAEVGPYAGVALNGKIKYSGPNYVDDLLDQLNSYGQYGDFSELRELSSEFSSDKEIDIEFGNEEDQMKRLDYGLTFGGGIQFSRIKLAVNYDLGLANLSNTDDFKFKTKTLAFSVAYMFGK